MLLLLVVSMATFGLIHGDGENQFTVLDYLSCDFEVDDYPFCWYSSVGNNPWKRQLAKDALGGKPVKDHSHSSEGHYVYTEGSSRVHSQLQSRDFTVDKPHCLSFWYYFDDSRFDFLDVYGIDSNCIATKLYSSYPVSNGKNYQSLHGYVDITENIKTIVFYGAISDVEHSDQNHFIGLDSIKLYDTTCAEQNGS